MEFDAVVNEVQGISLIMRKSRELMIRLRLRLGSLFERIYDLFAIKKERMLLEIPVAKEDGTFRMDRRLYTNANKFIVDRFGIGASEIKYMMRFYSLCCEFPALISIDKPWSWIKATMTDDVLATQITAFKEREHEEENEERKGQE